MLTVPRTGGTPARRVADGVGPGAAPVVPRRRGTALPEPPRPGGLPGVAGPSGPSDASRALGVAGPSGASDASRTPLAVPAHSLPQRTPAELLTLARRGLVEAAGNRVDGLRYATAHLAALRAAAAVLAARARPAPGRRGRPTSVWALLAMVAPELSEWAGFFAAGAVKRAAAEAGIPRTVTAREADDLVRDAGRFLVVVESTLGFVGRPLPAGIDIAGAAR